MASMKSATLVVSLLALGVSAGLAASCATAPPPAPIAAPAPPPAPLEVAKPVLVEPKFAPPQVAGGALVASLLTMSPSRIVGDLDALSQRLSLPMMLGSQLLSLVGTVDIGGKNTQLGAVWDRLDTSMPVSIVWVLPPNQAAKGYCAALTFVDRAAAARTFDEMGTPGAARDGISERRVSSGETIWGGIKDRTLFISGSAEALLLGGGLAESARTVVPKDQLVMTVLPQALAKASGKTADALSAQVASGMLSSFAAAKAKNTKAAEQMLVAGADVFVRLALDSSVARLIVGVGPAQGLSIRAELVPVPGTDWSKRIAARAPYSFDARLPVRSDATSVMAAGNISEWALAFGGMFEATGPAGKAMLRDMKKMVELVADWSCTFDARDVGVATLCSSTLRQGVAGKAALDAAVGLIGSQHAWEGEIEGRKLRPLKIKRSADKVEIEKKIETAEPTARALAKAMAGGDSFHYVISVKDGRLVQAGGPKPKDTLALYGTASAVKDAPLVASALERTKGDEAMASVDVVSFLLRMLKQGKGLPGAELAAMASAMPGVVDMKAPLLFAVRGGNSLTAEFAIPLGSLEAVASVVRSALGALPSPPPKQ
jgi:hypothetical protein